MYRFTTPFGWPLVSLEFLHSLIPPQYDWRLSPLMLVLSHSVTHNLNRYIGWCGCHKRSNQSHSSQGYIAWCGCHEILIPCSATALSSPPFPTDFYLSRCGWVRTTPFHSSGSNFFVSNSCFTIMSERSSYHKDRKITCLETSFIKAKDFFRVAECNQDFGAPAPCHILLWAAGLFTSFVTPAWRENAFWCCVFDCRRESCSGDTETEWEIEGLFEGGRRPTKRRSGSKAETIRKNIQDSEWIMRTERSLSSIGKEGMIILFHSSNLSRRLPFCGGILQFRATNQEQPESAFAQSNWEIERLQMQLMTNPRNSTKKTG